MAILAATRPAAATRKDVFIVDGGSAAAASSSTSLVVAVRRSSCFLSITLSPGRNKSSVVAAPEIDAEWVSAVIIMRLLVKCQGDVWLGGE